MKMNNKTRLFVDIHVMQTVPPNCVNRDDTGSPKTAFYGGARRARVSSQAWKRAVRMAFRDMYAPEDLGVRTKRIVRMVQKHIEALDPGRNAEKEAVKVLQAAGLPINEKDPDRGTEALFFMSEAQAEALAQIAVNDPDKMKDKDACRLALKEHASIDLALFGRMVASDPSLNYDAAAKVAHAISTHSVQNEYDYFTAVDDLSSEDNAGAGHLGTVEFNSSTLYRYATVNVRELAASVGEMTASAVRHFVEAFACSMPTGKQNTFANRTLPEAIYVVVRKDQPINLAGAFERPVEADPLGGYSVPSCTRLSEYASKVYSDYSGKPVKAWSLGTVVAESEKLPLPELLDALEEYLSTEMNEG